MRPILLTLLAALCVAARADTLAELNAALEGFPGETTVSAEVNYEYWSETGDKDGMDAESCNVSASLDEDAHGLHVHWRRDTLADAAEEVRAASISGEVKTPMRRAMGLLSATVLSGYLNGAAELSRWLGQSELTREEASEWKGAPARLLVLKNTPRVNAQTRKYLKELDATVRVWVGEGGVPLAAERRVRFRGRALLVVSFESTDNDAYEFAVSGDRLVVTRHERETHGSGTGGKNTQKTIATLTLAVE